MKPELPSKRRKSNDPLRSRVQSRIIKSSASKKVQLAGKNEDYPPKKLSGKQPIDDERVAFYRAYGANSMGAIYWLKSEQRVILDLVYEHFKTNDKMGYPAWRTLTNQYNQKMKGTVAKVGEEFVWSKTLVYPRLTEPREAPVRTMHAIRNSAGRWSELEEVKKNAAVVRSKNSVSLGRKQSRKRSPPKQPLKLGKTILPNKKLLENDNDESDDDEYVPFAIRRMNCQYDKFPGLDKNKVENVIDESDDDEHVPFGIRRMNCKYDQFPGLVKVMKKA